MRKTKIICTLGPASDSDAVLERLIQEGMDETSHKIASAA